MIKQSEKVKLENFISKSIQKFGDIFNYDKVNYINNRTNIIITCKEHGDFSVTPSNFLNNNKFGCPKCGIDYRGKNKKLKLSDFVEKSNIIHTNFYDYSKVELIYAHEKVCIICPEHGEFWQSPSSHLQGYGCKQCGFVSISKANLISNDEFINNALKVHGNKYDYSKVNYIGSNNLIEIICPLHGSFFQSPNAHVNSTQGCPKCKLKSQSKLFNKLSKDITSFNIEWEYSPEWLGRQKFDMAILDLKVAIEYNGKQHYEPISIFGGEEQFIIQRERDELKRQKCLENGWKLFELKYNYNTEDYNNLLKNLHTLSYA